MVWGAGELYDTGMRSLYSPYGSYEPSDTDVLRTSIQIFNGRLWVGPTLSDEVTKLLREKIQRL